MSRMGKKPVAIPAGVTVTVDKDEIAVKGPKGSLHRPLVPGITVSVDSQAKQVVVMRDGDDKQRRALHGLYRSLINNMVTGVTQGYEKRLRIVGTGFRVELQGRTLVLQAGFCHPVNVPIPAGMDIEVPKASSREYMEFIVRGMDKQHVGELAAQLRRIRPPDLYQGKGIRYTDEKVRRLEGKSFTSGGA